MTLIFRDCQARDSKLGLFTLEPSAIGYFATIQRPIQISQAFHILSFKEMADKEKRVLSIQSTVVHGYAGGRSAVFPLQLHGFVHLPKFS